TSASDFESRKSYVENNRALASALGIMRYCNNADKEEALLKHAMRVQIRELGAAKPSVEEPQSYAVVRDRIQALDFQAVGIARGLSFSGIAGEAHRNICSLGLELSNDVLAGR